MKKPRGVAVVDVGYTHSKLLLFNSSIEIVDWVEIPSGHSNAGDYPSLDLEPLIRLIESTLPDFDAQIPLDRIVPSAHGSGLALVDSQGELTFPVMDYAARPPSAILEKYKSMAPAFSEVFAPVLPGALTLGLQLFWQQTSRPDLFDKTSTIMPWAQYAAFRMGGAPVSEITAFGAQTQLLDVRSGTFSSLARSQGWDQKFAPLVRAFDSVGRYEHSTLHGDGTILAGIHDSNANYLRYIATGLENFTLLSTGTWIIGFTPGVDLTTIDPKRDVVSNADYLGRPVASCRFMGGKEFEAGAAGAEPSQASVARALQLINLGSMALPSFTDSGGPIPGYGQEGRFVGPNVENEADRASLMSIYCGLMSWQSLTAVGGDSDIVVDGPFAKNDVYLTTLATLLPGRKVLASDADQGTAIGAALLAHCDELGNVPRLTARLRTINPLEASGLEAYSIEWLRRAERQSA